MENLVARCRQTLFVAVDEYDTPCNRHFFNGKEIDLDTIIRIENFFKSHFFFILKAACGEGPFISKYFLTGVLPTFRAGIISPLTAGDLVSTYPKLHGYVASQSMTSKL